MAPGSAAGMRKRGEKGEKEGKRKGKTRLRGLGSVGRVREG